YRGSPPRNPFVIERCGWCGTHLMPVAPTEDRGKFGFRIVDAGGAMRLSTYCTHSSGVVTVIGATELSPTLHLLTC
ncbi:MAG: hypothetical protein NT023_04075, partial [Armatimonadetes bacterium]|nr:hypothetical protein [Armatimonadota bacterium]